jgi:zinc transporter ZupT
VQGAQWVVLAAEAGGEHGPSAALVFGAAALLALVHLLGWKLRFLDRIPRSRWLSGAGGVSVAYVFVHVLPELEAGGAAIEASDIPVLTFFERHVYLVAMAGFVAFYGLERLARGQGDRDESSRGTESDRGRETADENGGTDGSREPENEERTSGNRGVFWIHVGSFAIYNALIGRLLGHEQGLDLLTYTVAIGLHFLVNDVGLREIHGELYRRVGRWLLAGAILLGAAVGVVTEIREALFATVFAFVAGGIVLNVIKEELPEERASRFLPFAVGAVGYAIVLLLI